MKFITDLFNNRILVSAALGWFVAQVLKTNPSAVQTRLQRAREKLKAALTEAEKEETPYVRPKLVL